MNKFDLLLSNIKQENIESPRTRNINVPTPSDNYNLPDIRQQFEIKAPPSAAIKPTNRPNPKECIFEGIIKGDNWFEVIYPSGDKRFVRHSTKQNLFDYYSKLNRIYRVPIPETINAINYNEQTSEIHYLD